MSHETSRPRNHIFHLSLRNPSSRSVDFLSVVQRSSFLVSPFSSTSRDFHSVYTGKRYIHIICCHYRASYSVLIDLSARHIPWSRPHSVWSSANGCFKGILIFHIIFRVFLFGLCDNVSVHAERTLSLRT